MCYLWFALPFLVQIQTWVKRESYGEKQYWTILDIFAVSSKERIFSLYSNRRSHGDEVWEDLSTHGQLAACMDY